MKEIIALLKQNAVGVFPTDTLYGIVTPADSEKSVERIYTIKGRDEHKPFIILVASLADVTRFTGPLNATQKRFLNSVWPGAVSVIIPCRQKKYTYLHRGSMSLAFRMPEDPFIRSVLKKTGPLVAPSANPQSKEPAYTIREAEAYFGPALDFYVDVGRKKGKPSTLVDLTTDEPRIVRQGSVRIKPTLHKKK